MVSHRRHFDFTGRTGIPDYQYHRSFQVAVGEALTFDVLQYLFEDLYLQWRFEPKYLFIAEADNEALKAEMYKSIGESRDSQRRTEMHYGLWPVNADTPSRPPIAQIVNFATGHYVHVVSLPDLEPGSVILGFFQ